jgi:CheY-like chemotaxis protein
MAVILLLEDNEEFRSILAENLEDEGHTIHQAASGREAVEVGARTPVDLVITDVRMAGIDGIDALAGLREIHPNLRSIVITGYANDEAPSRAIKQGACDYLYKPFKLSELLTSIERVLNADDDNKRATAALGSVLKGFGKLASAVGSLLSNQQLKLVEMSRSKAYTGLYVAIRSRSFGVEQALRVWDSLEDLERKRQGLLSGKLDLALCRDLGEGYSWVMTVLEALKRNNIPLIRSPEHERRLPRERFAHLYYAVQEGRIPAAQLSLAPFLRVADSATLRQSPDLLKLHRRFWGA